MAEWTDERMDDLASQMAAGFDRTDRAIGDVRGEIAALRTEVKADIDGLRTEVKADIDGLRTEVKADIDGLRTEVKADIGVLQAMMFRFCLAAILCMGGLATALVGVLAVGPG